MEKELAELESVKVEESSKVPSKVLRFIHLKTLHL